MAEIAGCFASSHSVMLTATLVDWQRNFRVADSRSSFHDRQGRPVTYNELLALAPLNAAELSSDAAIAERFDQVHAAMRQLRHKVHAAKLDVMLICGDDQYELFSKNLQPPIAIYHGDDIPNGKKRELPADAWFKIAQNGRLEDVEGVRYPVDSALALHLIRGLLDHDFDIATLAGIDAGKFVGHAYSFIQKTYLEGTATPIVPIFLNTHYGPNPTLPRRCVELGLAIRELLLAYPKDLRIGFMASGGLSHFQVEEDLDLAVIEALRSKDLGYLRNLDPRRLQAGSSEIRNWLVLAGVYGDLDMDWVSYSPGYRSKALTGTGLAFASWS